MKLKITDTTLYFLFDSTDEHNALDSILTFDNMANVFCGGTFDKNKIKKVHFLKKRKNVYYCNAGFLYEILNFIKSNQFKVTELKDERTKFDFNKKDFSYEELKSYFNPNFKYVDHQVKTLTKLLKINNGIACLPTSAGKGDIIAAYIKVTNLPTLVLVNKVLLCEQLYERFKEYGIEDIGLNTGSKVINPNGKVVVSTIGSVFKLNLTNFVCLIGDEIHNFSANTFQDFLSKVSYPIKIGFSATPNKGDKYKFALIRQYFGSVTISVESNELIENGVMAKPIIYFIKNHVNNEINYKSSYLNEIVLNNERNDTIVKICDHFNLPTLILLQDVVNGQGLYLKDKLESLGKKVSFINGGTKDRYENIENLENDEIDVLIATGILNEGVSIKNIKLLINASGLKSFSLTAQKIGRGLRIKENKDKVAIIDFLDEGNYFLSRHANQRISIFKKLGYTDIYKVSLNELLQYDERNLLER